MVFGQMVRLTGNAGVQDMDTVNVKRKICVFTGTRAEYGLLKPVMQRLKEDARCELQIIVSGSHLSTAGGYTEQQIIEDGFTGYERVEILLDGGSDTSVYTAVGLGLLRFGDVLKRLQPDMVVVLGDRFEAFAFAAAATICKVPIAHIHGGELTLGAIDDSLRHAITKLSHLHFAATEEYRKRIIQMGESPDRVFNVGALGVFNAKSVSLLSRNEVERRTGLQDGQKFFLLTYHPATLGSTPAAIVLKNVVSALLRFSGYAVVATGANADQEGSSINQMLQETAKAFPDSFKFLPSLGTQLYLSAVSYAQLVLGNSSSGIIEAPSFRVPVVDIGIRQKGRIRSQSVITCGEDSEDIYAAIQYALTEQFQALARASTNPYEKQGTVDSMIAAITQYPIEKLLEKNFVDLAF